MDPNLNQLLKWSVENTTNPTANPEDAARGLNPELLATLFGGPSEAQLMQESMAAILSDDPEMDLEAKLVAFDNFEQLIENLDNANLMEPLKLWPSLIGLLQHEEAEMRKYAAWCIGTSVQNNTKSQQMLVKEGGIKPLVDVATKKTEDIQVRRKAVYALSSALRNMQEAMDGFLKEMEAKGKSLGAVDAGDMDAVDNIINEMREAAKNSA